MRQNAVAGTRVYFRMRTINICGIIGDWSDSVVYENQPVDGKNNWVNMGFESIGNDDGDEPLTPSPEI